MEKNANDFLIDAALLHFNPSCLIKNRAWCLEVTLILNSKVDIVTKFQVPNFKNCEVRRWGVTLPPPRAPPPLARISWLRG